MSDRKSAGQETNPLRRRVPFRAMGRFGKGRRFRARGKAGSGGCNYKGATKWQGKQRPQAMLCGCERKVCEVAALAAAGLRAAFLQNLRVGNNGAYEGRTVPRDGKVREGRKFRARGNREDNLTETCAAGTKHETAGAAKNRQGPQAARMRPESKTNRQGRRRNGWGRRRAGYARNLKLIGRYSGESAPLPQRPEIA